MNIFKDNNMLYYRQGITVASIMSFFQDDLHNIFFRSKGTIVKWMCIMSEVYIVFIKDHIFALL